jgi:TPR repeat protein
MNRIKVAAALILGVVCVGSAAAGPFEDANDAVTRGDYATAIRLLRPLADRGDALAQESLGKMYEFGEGVPEDYATAVSWYRKAAEQGDVDAQWDLGRMYYGGRGVPENNVLAHMWLNLAAVTSDSAKRFSAAALRDQVAATMSPAQIAEAQRLAREWKPK